MYSRLFIIFLLVGCAKSKSSEQFMISDRFEVLDENISKERVWCENEVSDFLKMNELDCSFKIGENEFDIVRRLRFDGYGALSEYWVYHPEGPLIYSIEDLKSDLNFFKSTQVDEIKVRFLDQDTITDSTDTLEVDSIIPRYKLIICRQSDALKSKKMKFIYKYL